MGKKNTLLAAAGILLCCALFFCLHLSPPGTRTALSPNMESLPLYGKAIGVDAGHGGYDGGCEGVSGKQEKKYNLEIALKVGESIRALGGTPVFTRTEDVALIDPKKTTGYKKRQELDNRIRLLREGNVDALVSIHMNKYKVAKYRGAQLFYRADSQEGKCLANCLQKALETLQDPNLRPPASGEYYILGACEPALLVECGFLSNPEEERLLGTEEYQQRLAQLIAEGIADYFAQAKSGE